MTLIYKSYEVRINPSDLFVFKLFSLQVLSILGKSYLLMVYFALVFCGTYTFLPLQNCLVGKPVNPMESNRFPNLYNCIFSAIVMYMSAFCYYITVISILICFYSAGVLCF